MKYTVLEMTQDILSAMDSDEVNSISDTVEATQVATIIKNCYNDITTDVEFPDQYSLLQLDASGDPTKPVTMTIPFAYTSLTWVKYNKQGDPLGSGPDASQIWTTPDGVTVYFGTAEADMAGAGGTSNTNIQFKDITFLPKEEFLKRVMDFNSEDPIITTYEVTEYGRNIPLLCRNDKHPDYWTSFDNRTILFDSYLDTVDTTLQTSKTLCWGKKATRFIMSDNWEIPLDDKFTSYLFNEAKATSFSELKQISNSRAEKQARLAKIKTQKTKTAAPYDAPAHDQSVNYGRRFKPNHYKGYNS